MPPLPTSTEWMTASELLLHEANFHAHFRLKDGTLSPLRNTRSYWPWAQVVTLMNERSVTVQGIYINYGLAENRFIPVLEFYSKDAEGKFVHMPDMAYVYGVDEFIHINDQERKALVDAYLSHVLVRRKATDTTYVALRDQQLPNDPRGIWYDKETKLTPLFKNAGDVNSLWMGVTCISSEMKLASTGALEDDLEFRHMLALHLARETPWGKGKVLVDLLNDHSEAPLALKAMDLGNVCPPNCTSGRP